MDNVRKHLPEEEEQKIDLQVYWKIFWRKKYFLIIPLVISTGIALFGVRYLTPIYESATLVSVEEQNILSQTMGRYVTPLEERRRVRSQQYRAMIETRVQSREFLEMVIRDLGINRSYNIRQEIENSRNNPPGLSIEERIMRRLTAMLREKISVQTTMPGFYSLSVLDSDPGTAYILASKIADKYIEVTQQAKLLGLREAGAFSDEQLAIYKEKLEGSEKELSLVQKELDDTDVQTNPVNASNLNVAEARKRSLEAETQRNRIALDNIRRRLNSIFGLVPSSDRIAGDETIKNIETRLLTRSEEELLGTMGGEPQERADDNSIDLLWNELRNRISEIVFDEYAEFSADVRPLITEYYYQRYLVEHFSTRERRLQGYIDRYKENIAQRPHLEMERNRLNHEVETNRAIYEAFLESKTSTQITEAVQSTNLGVRINVIEKAERPFIPVKPNKIKIIILALVFGISCGISAILVTEYADDSFRSVEEVQRIMKAPVLGTVPKTVAHFEWERKRQGKIILIWIISLFIFISIVSGALYMYARALKSSGIGVELTTEQTEG